MRDAKAYIEEYMGKRRAAQTELLIKELVAIITSDDAPEDRAVQLIEKYNISAWKFKVSVRSYPTHAPKTKTERTDPSLNKDNVVDKVQRRRAKKTDEVTIPNPVVDAVLANKVDAPETSSKVRVKARKPEKKTTPIVQQYPVMTDEQIEKILAKAGV